MKSGVILIMVVLGLVSAHFAGARSMLLQLREQRREKLGSRLPHRQAESNSQPRRGPEPAGGYRHRRQGGRLDHAEILERVQETGPAAERVSELWRSGARWRAGAVSVQRQADTPAKTMPPEAEGVSPGSRSNRQTGGVAAEFALVLIPFLVVLFGIIDLGHFFWTDHVVTEAAREGARWAILNEPSNAEVQGAITQKMTDGGISATPTISISGRAPVRR